MVAQHTSRSTRLRLVEPQIQPAGTSDLLSLVGPVADRTVLLIGADTLELMCRAIRAGCAGVEARPHGQLLHAEPADIVIIRDVASAETIRQALAIATRQAGGAVSVLVQLRGDASHGLVLQARTVLLEAGCTAGRVRRLPGMTAILAQRMPRPTRNRGGI